MNFSEMSSMEMQQLMDPFLIINEELHDLIYQHFTGEEVKKLSEVSKGWKYGIGISTAAMKKILFSYEPTMSMLFNWEDVEQFFQLSQRRYYNVKLFSVYIPKRTRSHYEQFQVVEKISGSVRFLEIGYFCSIGDVGLQFPKLEKIGLEMSWSSSRPILGGVTASKLKRLDIELDDEDDLLQFQGFLMKCNKLEEFSLSDHRSEHSIFGAGLTFPFKLKKFSMDTIKWNTLWTPTALQKFEKFLKSQSSSLQVLKLHYCTYDLLEIALKSLTLLKDLNLYMTFKPRQLMAVNTSVESLNLRSNSPALQSPIIPVLPNLQTLNIGWIHKNTIEVIASTLMNLRSVIYFYSDMNVIQYYTTFRQMNPNVNQNIQWTRETN